MWTLLSKCITTVDGKEIHFSDLANAFEKLFNIKFSDIYKKKKRLSNVSLINEQPFR